MRRPLAACELKLPEHREERPAVSYAQQMIDTHPAGGIAAEHLAACIEACFDCAQACTACADACLAEPSLAGLVRCIRLNLDCADACDATGRTLSRLTALDGADARQLIEACADVCRRCAEECERHAAMGMEHCRVCAEACRRCAEACRALMASMAA
jgi:hypothetical protein